MSAAQPSFLDAYLVADTAYASPVGVVRKDRAVWRIYLFGRPLDRQPREAFATRQEAGARVLELAADRGQAG